MKNNGTIKMILDRFQSIDGRLDKLFKLITECHTDNQKRISVLESAKAKITGIIIACWLIAGLLLSALALLGFNYK